MTRIATLDLLYLGLTAYKLVPPYSIAAL